MTVPAGDIFDPGFVQHVFDGCSPRYRLISTLCSFGFAGRWRRQCVRALPESGPGALIGYDLMAGTGEVWPHLFRERPMLRSLVAVDISDGMHKRAMARLHADAAYPVRFIAANVLESPLPAHGADLVVSTFGLKTFNPAQQAQLARQIAHLLRPGGVFALIEVSDPKGWVLRPALLFYLHHILPLLERLLLHGAQDFAMIGPYLDHFGDMSGFATLLREQGLDVVFRRHFFGCATSVAGRKPSA